MDTEIYDNFSGHEISTVPSRYYGIFPGWYLCETTIPLNTSAAGASILAALIGGIQNGGSSTSYGGARIAASSSFNYQAAAAKLMLMEQAGTFNGADNDYIFAAVQQDNAASSAQPLFQSVGAFPYLSCRWVSALSGIQPLAVPANPSWPVPPSYVTSAFMNTNVRNAVNFLIYPPIMEAVRTVGGGSLASVTTPPTVGATVNCDTETVDNYNAYANPTWTAPVGGVYYCYGCVAVNTGANAVSLGAGLTVTSANYNSGTQITLWGGTITSVPSSEAAAVVRKRLRFNAGDTVLLAAMQNDSGAAAVTYSGSSAFEPRLIIVWESA
jgi:hypothetical protein